MLRHPNRKVPQVNWDQLLEKHAAQKLEPKSLTRSPGNASSVAKPKSHLVDRPEDHAPKYKEGDPKEFVGMLQRNRRLKGEWHDLKTSIHKAVEKETDYLVQKPLVSFEGFNQGFVGLVQEPLMPFEMFNQGSVSLVQEPSVPFEALHQGSVGRDPTVTNRKKSVRFVDDSPETSPSISNSAAKAELSQSSDIIRGLPSDELGGPHSAAVDADPRDFLLNASQWLDAHNFGDRPLSQRKQVLMAMVIEEKDIYLRYQKNLSTPLQFCWDVLPLREMMQWIGLGWPENVTIRDCIIHLNHGQWQVEKAQESFEASLSESSKRRKDIFFGKTPGITSSISGKTCVTKQFQRHLWADIKDRRLVKHPDYGDSRVTHGEKKAE